MLIGKSLRHGNEVFMEAAILPQDLSCDEESIALLGKDKKKMRLKFKKVKGVYQTDALCCDGYTFTFYVWHQPPPDNYIKQGYSPLHACVMFMFDQLQSPHHNVYIYNLCMSALFCKRAQNSKKKVNTHGVCNGE